MSLLPEDQVAAHITKVLDAAFESALPVWRKIDASQAERFILQKVSTADALTVDHQIVQDSYWLARRNKKNWGPWYIAEILMDQAEARYAKQKAVEAKAASDSKMARGIAEARDIDADKKAFEDYRKSLSFDDVRIIQEKWRQKVGCMKAPGAGRCVKWEYAEREKAQQ